MKNILLFALMLIVPAVGFSQKKKIKKANEDTAQWRYEIEALEVGTQGTCLVKVWSYSKKPEVASSQSRKNAVHGVIFKGIPAKDRIPGKKPLVQNASAEAEHADFFKNFFADGGAFMRFVTLTNNGAIEAGDVMKIGKEYKVGVNVTVNYSELRKAMEDAGVIKKLGAGF